MTIVRVKWKSCKPGTVLFGYIVWTGINPWYKTIEWLIYVGKQISVGVTVPQQLNVIYPNRKYGDVVHFKFVGVTMDPIQTKRVARYEFEELKNSNLPDNWGVFVHGKDIAHGNP